LTAFEEKKLIVYSWETKEKLISVVDASKIRIKWNSMPQLSV
jgi:hypothetical protein